MQRSLHCRFQCLQLLSLLLSSPSYWRLARSGSFAAGVGRKGPKRQQQAAIAIGSASHLSSRARPLPGTSRTSNQERLDRAAHGANRGNNPPGMQRRTPVQAGALLPNSPLISGVLLPNSSNQPPISGTPLPSNSSQHRLSNQHGGHLTMLRASRPIHGALLPRNSSNQPPISGALLPTRQLRLPGSQRRRQHRQHRTPGASRPPARGARPTNHHSPHRVSPRRPMALATMVPAPPGDRPPIVPRKIPGITQPPHPPISGAVARHPSIAPSARLHPGSNKAASDRITEA